MRICAVLALSVGACFVAVPNVHAAAFCDDPDRFDPSECIPASSPQHALDLAGAHPGHDEVYLGPAEYRLDSGLVYSDGGSSDNGVTINGTTRCSDRYTCRSTRLDGGSPGSALLSFTGGGGAAVEVVFVTVAPAAGVTGMVLPPGGLARNLSAFGGYGSVGIRLEGTAARPAVVRQVGLGGSPAIDAPGHGIVERSWIDAVTGVRARGSGSVDVRGGTIRAFDGVTGPNVRVTGTAIDFAEPSHPGSGVPVGIEAACEGPGSPDAVGTLANVTLVGYDRAGGVGVRAAGRGGDGAGCDAVVRMSSSLVHQAPVSLAADGEAGSGADPRDGTARIEASYSSFSLAAARQSGPAQLETSTPGQNLEGDPVFAAAPSGWPPHPLLWRSPLVDRGDPAPPEDWQRPWIDVVNGRRDIGAHEYGFRPPQVNIYRTSVVPPRTRVKLTANAFDPDAGDPIRLDWKLPGGRTAGGSTVAVRFARTGSYTVRVKATDPTGRSGEASEAIRVVRQRLGLRVRPRRFRPGPRGGSPRPAARIHLRLAASDSVALRVHRAVRGPDGALRWRRVRGSRKYRLGPGVTRIPFEGWMRHRLRPGLHRMTATSRSGAPPARAKFRVLR